jgi:hypothetical protein
MSKRIVSWLPWVLAEGTLGFLEAQLWPAGGLWLLLIWTAVLLLYRVALATASGRSVRVVGDLAFAGLCVLAVFEGGWYLLPAVVAFAACDAAGLTIELPSLPNDRGGYELRAALACTLLGWLGLAISVSGPIYASASSTVSANGVVVNSPPEVSLLQAGLTTQTAQDEEVGGGDRPNRPAGRALVGEHDRIRLIVELEHVRVVLLQIDRGQLHRVRLELDGASHLVAGVSAPHIPGPATHPPGRIR